MKPENVMDAINSTIYSLLDATARRMEVPAMFGTFHIAAVLIAVIIAAAGASYAKRLSVSGRIRFLAVCGWVLVIMEVYKQLFLYFIVSGGTYDWWYFPFQLCSVPMYLCILLPLLSRVAADVKSSAASPVLTFLAVYTFTGAAAALIIPEDYLRSYAALTLHGFIWHGILLMISLTILLSRMADLTRRGFARATALFLVMCAAAVCINITVEPLMAASYAEGLIPHSYAAMFYLNPYHLSPQPLVDTIQKSAGIPLGLALYVISIIAVSGLLTLLFRRLFSASAGSHR
jgi:uncharacterized membrane protein YwaF